MANGGEGLGLVLWLGRGVAPPVSLLTAASVTAPLPTSWSVVVCGRQRRLSDRVVEAVVEVVVVVVVSEVSLQQKVKVVSRGREWQFQGR